MKSAQIAIEFLMFTMISVVIVIILVALGINLAQNSFSDQQEEELLDLSISLQEEFLLASVVELGYHRTFNVPTRLTRGTFELSNDNTSFSVWSQGINITHTIPTTIGTLRQGTNKLVNTNGTIYLNP